MIPHSMESERGLLGSMLIDPRLTSPMIREGITAESFFHPPHGTIWIACTQMEAQGESVDFVTLTSLLKDRGQLEAVGGPAAISQLYTFTPTITNWRAYCATVLEKAERRKIIKDAQALYEQAFDASEDIAKVRESAQNLGLSSARKSVEGADVQHLKTPMVEFLESVEAAQTGTDTRLRLEVGLPHLEMLTHGFPPGNLVTIGAQTSVGKTAFALQCAWKVASGQRKPVLFVSLEMSSQKLAGRIAASTSGISLSKLHAKKPELSDYEFNQLTGSMAKVGLSELFLWTPKSTPTAAEVVAMMRMQKMEKPDLALVVVDYLQLLAPSDAKEDNRERQVADMSRQLARAAVSLDLVVIALSQLNDKDQLRESRAVGHDSRIVGFLTRPKKAKDDGTRTLFLAKNSEGQSAIPIDLHFNGERQTFTEVHEE